MEIIDLFITPWLEFSDFKSKSSRREFWVFALGNLFVFFLLFIVALTSYESLLTDDFREFIEAVLYDLCQMSALLGYQQHSFVYVGVSAFLLASMVWIAFILCPIAFYAFLFIVLLPISFSTGIYMLQLFMVYSLLVMIPQYSLTIRRLRDVGYGPLTYFVQLIPFVGNLILLFLLIMKNPNNKV